MSRLIDADALIEFIDCGHLRNPLEMCFSERDVVDMIESRPTVPQLIPVSERLPEQQEMVLIQDFNYITIGYLNGENRWRDLTNIDDYLKGVIAWMPLPELYQE